MEEGWTIRPLTPPTPEDKAKEFFVHDPNSDIISGKVCLYTILIQNFRLLVILIFVRCQIQLPYAYQSFDQHTIFQRFVRNFVQRFYPDGRIFLTVFPDGTGNVWYPSKNVAVSILASEKIGKLIFILHEARILFIAMLTKID